MEPQKTKIILASDHAGFELKEKLKKVLEQNEIPYDDFSPKLVQDDDYPDITFKAAQRVAKAKEMGVFVCGTGMGMCIAANKVKGIMAAVAYDENMARAMRQHNNANVLCLGARLIDEKTAVAILKAWLTTRFLEGRHTRRVDRIKRFESGL